jgi:predicted metal-dependent phosphoesterase TrpH
MGFNTNFANMHLHSTHSDGQFSPFHLAVLAKSLGYGGVVLSDHDVISSNIFRSDSVSLTSILTSAGLSLWPGSKGSTTLSP